MRSSLLAGALACTLAASSFAAPIERAAMRTPESVADYKLAATLDPVGHTVKGEGTLTWRNTSRVPVTELWFHLYLNGFRPGSLFLIEAANEGGRGSATTTGASGSISLVSLLVDEPGGQNLLPTLVAKGNASDAPDDETDARVTLERAVPPGGTIRLSMKWTSILPAVVERTGYGGSFHMVGQWFPKIARLENDGTWAHFPFHHLAEFYADFGSYEVTIKAPQAFVVGATGTKTKESLESGQRVVTYAQDRVHDFAFTAWDQFRERNERIEGVDVRLLFPPGYEGAAARSVRAMQTAFPSFARRVGPYPYSTLTIVHPPHGADEAGGMEYPTLITTGGSWNGSPTTYDVERVTIHEFGHQYFYGLLASNEERHPFLDEGLNTFVEGLVARDMFGSGSLLPKIGPFEPDGIAMSSLIARQRARDHAVSEPAYAFRSGRAYGSLVYARTGALMETFSRSYGPCVTDGVQNYFREWHFRHPEPRDFFASMRAACGDTMADALVNAIDHRGSVDVAAVSLIEVDGTSRLEASNRGSLRLPIDIEFWMRDGTKVRQRYQPVTDGSFTVSVPGIATHAVLDPDRKLLVDVNWQDNHVIAKHATPAGSPFTMDRAMFWLSSLFLGATP